MRCTRLSSAAPSAPLAPPTTTSCASLRPSCASVRTATSRPFSGCMRPTNNKIGPLPSPRACRAPRRSPGEKNARSTPGATTSIVPGALPYNDSNCDCSSGQLTQMASAQPMISSSDFSRTGDSISPPSPLTRANVWNVVTRGKFNSCFKR